MIGDTIHMYNLQQNAFAHDMNLAHISSKFKQVVHCKKLLLSLKQLCSWMFHNPAHFSAAIKLQK